MDNAKKIKELVDILNKAAFAYYQQDKEVMPNIEYDKLYDELVELENKTGIVMSGSPTNRVGYEVLSELPKREHEVPMLSLDKTKSVDDLKDWIGEQRALLSWKLDGLTIVLRYMDGELESAITRGNGSIGEVVTANARAFDNIPLKISFKGELIIRGEAIISYSDFEKINMAIEDAQAKYKNPRNLCSGAVRQLNPMITKSRHVRFNAFSLVAANGMDFDNSRDNQLKWLKQLGFDVVEYRMVDRLSIASVIEDFSERVKSYDYPSDGLVLLMDDIEYGESLGTTSKFPRNAIAFKWGDEIRETTLRYIEWSTSRTGLINPIAVFEPVELEGTTVSRASVHNLSIMEELELGEGDIITVYKANMIIPQIADNLTRSSNIHVPESCPVCRGRTLIKQEKNVRTLHCTNPHCQIKNIKRFALLSGRDALNIDGLSEMTLEKFISRGFISEAADIFKISRFKEEIINMEGFGKKSYDKLISSIDKARATNLYRVVYSLGINGIGSANAKLICKYFKDDFGKFRRAKKETLLQIEGIGDVLADSIVEYFSNEENNHMVDELLKELDIITEKNESSQALEQKSFVITGSLKHFSNRNELQELIEKLGGKVAQSVSAKTDYLINNDKTSNSSKNKKAMQLNIQIISEQDFLDMIK